MSSDIVVNTGSDSGLLSDATKPLTARQLATAEISSHLSSLKSRAIDLGLLS